MVDCGYVKKLVEEVSGIKDLSARSRERYYCDARFTYYYLCRDLQKVVQQKSLSNIGKYVDRGHPTVLHGIQQFKNNYNKDGFTCNEVYAQCVQRMNLLIGEDDLNVDGLLKERDIKEYYKIRHLRHVEKTRSVINKLSYKLSLMRKNDFIKKILTLDAQDIEELEEKFDVYFKVKAKLIQTNA